MINGVTQARRIRKFTRQAIVRDAHANWMLYLMVLPVVAFFLIFHYLPLRGLALAFVNFKPKLGIFGSQFVGLEHFQAFFGSTYAWRVIRNTVVLSLLEICISLPLTIIFALMLNEVGNKRFKRNIQTISYLPYFISMVVTAGLILDAVSSRGYIGQLAGLITGQPENLLGKVDAWRPIYIISGLWQGIGFGSIIFVAALSGVDQELYEAAVVDGAGRWKQTWHITLPGISSTIVILLILRIGGMLSIGYEKTILLYNAQIYESADIISSFVYRKGLLDAKYDYATAIGLFNSVINTVLLLAANWFCRRTTETSLF